VIDAAIAEAIRWDKKAFTYSQNRRRFADEAFASFGEAAVDPLVAALEGPAKKAVQREVLVAALGHARSPKAAATLLAFADDGVDAVKKAARDGLAALGDAAIPVLEAAAGKKGKLKVVAEELLARVRGGGSDPSAAADVPAGVRALEEAKAKAAGPERDALLAAVGGSDHAPARRAIDAAIAKDATFAFAVLSDLAIANAAGTPSNVRADDFLYMLRAKLELPVARALAARVLAAIPEKGNWNPKYIVPQMLKELGDPILEPLAHEFRSATPPTAKIFVEWIEANAPVAGRGVLLACAADERKAVRGPAVAGLVRAGEAARQEVIALLARSDDAVLTAAEVLRASPAASAIPALGAALGREKSKKRKEAIEAAIAACKLAGGAAPADHGAMDADLAKRAAKRKKKLPDVGLPALRWRGGAPLSEGAARWLLGALADDEGKAEPDAELLAVRARIEDDGAHALARQLVERFGWRSEEKWVVYAVATLGDEGSLDAMGKQLMSWSSGGGHVLATHGVEALRRSAAPIAIRWLDHWTEEAHGKVQKEAAAALRRLCQDRGLDRDGLVDLATPREAKDHDGAIAAIRRRLEAAMIAARPYPAAHFRTFVLEHPLVRRAANGLVVRHSGGALFALGPDRTIAGEPAADGTFSFPHPCAMTDDEIAAMQDRLAAAGLAQPFPQLARPFSRDPEAGLAALRGRSIETRVLLRKLDELGYRRGSVEDAGLVYEAIRPLAAGWVLRVAHDGFVVSTGRHPDGPKNRVEDVAPSRRERDGVPPTPALKSEALEDLKKILG
jgi:hypothetical protein